jgi:diphthamide biosynthesis protein 2
VDEVAALVFTLFSGSSLTPRTQHLHADLIVHYGSACMSPTSQLPVFYVFGRKQLNIPVMISTIVPALLPEDGEPLRVLVLHDVEYVHCMAAVELSLRTSLKDSTLGIQFAQTKVPSS